MASDRKLMVSWVLLHKRASSTEKRTTSGHSIRTELSRSQFCLSVWPQATCLKPLTLSSEATTLPKSLEEQAVFKPLRTIQETTSPTSEVGLWTPRIFSTTVDPSNIKVKLKHTQLLSIRAVHSLLYHQRSMLLFKTNGELILRTLIARLMKLSAKSINHVIKSLRNLSQSDSRLVILFLSWSQCHTFIKAKESANLLSLRTLLIVTTMEISFSVTSS